MKCTLSQVLYCTQSKVLTKIYINLATFKPPKGGFPHKSLGFIFPSKGGGVLVRLPQMRPDRTICVKSSGNSRTH